MLKTKINKFYKSNECVVFVILVMVMITFSVINPAFLTARNMFDLFRTMIVTGIFACASALRCSGKCLRYWVRRDAEKV